VNLPPHLDLLRNEIRDAAADYGLDFFDTVFELIAARDMNMIGSYGGFPTRYPHWRFGMEFERMRKTHVYGLGKIYEMVINNDPCYAYLLRSNSLVDQKLVMAHVYAHSDFFKNNMWFGRTNRKMIDEMANHGSRVRAHIDAHGLEAVEAFMDRAFSLDNLIDRHSPFVRRKDRKRPRTEVPSPHREPPPRLKSKAYMEEFINPPEVLAERKRVMDEEQEREKCFPPEPEADILLFLAEHSPLEAWQRDILQIVREEAYYFLPQAQTKIVNEGWAAYWHSRIMTERALSDPEVVEYAEHHAGTVAPSPGRLNPYKLGMELFRDIEERWDTGRFGPEYERCDDAEARRAWDRKLGGGREKIFEVRRVYNDITFLDAFLTDAFCEAQKLYTYRLNPSTGAYEIANRDFEAIRRALLARLTNCGQPRIQVVDGNYANRGELYLRHAFEGMELALDRARDTLENAQAVWGRPVHLETASGGSGLVLSFDGTEHTEAKKELEDADRDAVEAAEG